MCPECQQRMKVIRSALVKGFKKGLSPGRKRVYSCSCGAQVSTLEIDETLLQEQARCQEERRQTFIREKAALEQKVYYLTQPTNLASNRLVRIRRDLLKILEQTF